MSTYRIMAFIAISLALFITLSEAGALSFGLGHAYRNGREIRAPFKNPEIMVARGFGKRDAGDNLTVGDKIELIGDDIDLASTISIDWLAKEMSTNPSLARVILHKFVDSNKDGLISPRELMGKRIDTNFNSINNDFY